MTETMTNTAADGSTGGILGRGDRGSTATALLRIVLGVIILVTWFDNLGKDLYTGDGLTGFINWLFAEDGNNSSLGFYQSLLESIVVPAAGFFAVLQLVVELAIGLGLLFGVLTRFFSLAAALFFLNLLLGYFGGHEWIWTYVLLLASALAVFIGYGGRTLGVDRILARRGPSPVGGLLW